MLPGNRLAGQLCEAMNNASLLSTVYARVHELQGTVRSMVSTKARDLVICRVLSKTHIIEG